MVDRSPKSCCAGAPGGGLAYTDSPTPPSDPYVVHRPPQDPVPPVANPNKAASTQELRAPIHIGFVNRDKVAFRGWLSHFISELLKPGGAAVDDSGPLPCCASYFGACEPGNRSPSLTMQSSLGFSGFAEDSFALETWRESLGLLIAKSKRLRKNCPIRNRPPTEAALVFVLSFLMSASGRKQPSHWPGGADSAVDDRRFGMAWYRKEIPS
ncbi:hypothetical protein ABID60_008064 [Bradyrhizobium sp. S3.5.5]